MRGRVASRAAIVTGLATVALSATAHAGVVTFTSTEVPRTIDDGLRATSTVTAPQGAPPVTDVDLVGVRVSGAAGGNHADRYLNLFRSSDPDRVFALALGCTTVMDFDITWDEQAAALFQGPADCTVTGSRRIAISRLLEFDAGNGQLYADGGWVVDFYDGGNPGALAPPVTLQRWALRVTYKPMTFTASADKQLLKKKLELTAKCSADCRVTSAGDAKGRSFGLQTLKTETLKVPLKPKAKRRLAKRGKAKIELEASNSLGDSLKETVKVKLKRGRAA